MHSAKAYYTLTFWRQTTSKVVFLKKYHYYTVMKMEIIRSNVAPFLRWRVTTVFFVCELLLCARAAQDIRKHHTRAKSWLILGVKTYSWFSRDVTKILKSKSGGLQKFYLHLRKDYLKIYSCTIP